MKDSGQTEINVSGIVIPCRWNAKGKAVAFSLTTFREDEYFLATDKGRTALERYLGQKVRIGGILNYDRHRQTIIVQKIQKCS